MGVKEVETGIWLVSFMSYDLGYIDLEERTLQPLENPFGPHAAAADQAHPAKTGQPHQAFGEKIKSSGETQASNAGEQLAEG